ncbi:MAG: DUF6527 family protein [Cyclobacteriaceae bacterium]|nr:DUF6527 family protein [Cyclobacteriaceae bacterium]
MKMLKHRFVENVPDQLEEGVLYISIPFETVIHKCCCGCGNEVVTPLSPAAWSLIFDGETVSLKPSIGNWNFACKSHYWIKKNRVQWAGGISNKQIEKVQKRDLIDNRMHYANNETNGNNVKWLVWLKNLFQKH